MPGPARTAPRRAPRRSTAAADAELRASAAHVDRRVAARDPLCADAVTRDDAVPLEQELAERSGIRLAREEPGPSMTSDPGSR